MESIWMGEVFTGGLPSGDHSFFRRSASVAGSDNPDFLKHECKEAYYAGKTGWFPIYGSTMKGEVCLKRWVSG
jgi:hypothetical protein